MPRTRPPYPPEFRLGGGADLRAGVRSPRPLAAELGLLGADAAELAGGGVEADRGERRTCSRAEERARLRELERENRVLREEREISEAGRGFLCQGDRSDRDSSGSSRLRPHSSPSPCCAAWSVSRVRASTPGSGGRLARRELADRELGRADPSDLRRVAGDLRGSQDLLGAELGDGVKVGKKRVARLMRQLGIRGADGKQAARGRRSATPRGLRAGSRRP